MYCPNCDTEMARKDIEGVTIDKCPSFGGVWLDAGELEIIRERAEEEGEEKGSPTGPGFGAGFALGLCL